MSRRNLCLLLLGALAVIGFACQQRQAGASPRARELLQMMRKAETSVDYAATARAEYWNGPQRKAADVKIYHQHPNRRLLIFNNKFYFGSDGTQDWIYDSKRKTSAFARAGTKSQRFWNQDADLLLRNYEVKVGGRVTVAGRTGIALEIIPRIRGRSRAKTVIDAETGVVLSREQFDANNNRVSRTKLTSIDYTPNLGEISFESPVPMKAQRPGATPMNRRELAGEMGFAVIVPAKKPQGFVVESLSLYRCTCCDHCGLKAAMVTLTDGLEHLTIYQSRPPFLGCSEETRDARGRNCNTDCFGQGSVVHRAKNDLRITVVGSLPQSELRQVARSVETG